MDPWRCVPLRDRMSRRAQELIDYVILHELTHLNIKNHSKKFWQELEKLEPKAIILDKKLKNYNLNYKI